MEFTIDQAVCRGVEAHKAGRLQEAEQLYAAILRADPGHPDANHNMGVLAASVGRPDDAIALLKTATECNPRNSQYWVSYINTLTDLGLTKDAKRALRKAKVAGLEQTSFKQLKRKVDQARRAQVRPPLSGGPTEYQLQDVLKLLNQGQLLKALGRARLLIENFPDSVALHNFQGAAYAGLGNTEAALASYRKAIKIDPEDADIFNNMGSTLRDLGDLDGAIDSYHRAIDLRPDFAEPYINLGNALSAKGDKEAALVNYVRAIEIRPDDAATHTRMGLVFQENGDLDEAIESYQQVIKIQPGVAEAYCNLGVAFHVKGDLDVALENYRQAIKIDPDYESAHKNLGTALEENEDYDSAIESYQQALKINPDSSSIRHRLASLKGVQTETAPRDYVENLFDGYAANFDKHLKDNLSYDTPDALAGMIAAHHPEGPVGSVLDLGCGTGLSGVALKSLFKRLEGVDLSSAMLRQAKQKDIYDKLSHMDIAEYLEQNELDFDYFVSADVLIYIGDLSQLFSLIKSRNKRNGRFAFSTEHRDEGDFFLETSGRYSHSRAYIEKLSKQFGYHLRHFNTTDLRKHKERTIKGGLYLLEF